MQPEFFDLNTPFTPVAPPTPAQPVTTSQGSVQNAGPVRTTTTTTTTKNAPPAKTAQPHASVAHDITHNDITNFLGGIVKQTATGAAKFANQAVDEGRNAYDTGRMETANVTHNTTAEANANTAANNAMTKFGNKGGLFNQGTITTQKETQQGTAHGAEKIAGDTAMLASWLLPGAGKVTGEAVTKVLGDEGVKAIADQIGLSTAGRSTEDLAANILADKVGNKLATKALSKATPAFVKAASNAVVGAKAGAVYGGGSAMYGGDDAKKVVLNILENAGAGALLGGGGTLAARGIKNATGKLAPTLKDILGSHTSLASNEIGAVGKNVKGVGDASPIDGYTNSQDLVKDYAQMIQDQNNSMKGGIKIPDGNGGYKRTSEHTPFYRQFFAANGKAPAKADYLTQAQQELDSGKAAYGASDTYKALQSREKAAVSNGVGKQKTTIENPLGEENTKTPYDTPEIKTMRQSLVGVPSTHYDMTPERQALRDKVGQMLYQQGGHADAAKAPYEIATNRQAHIVLGAPASGKTNIVTPLIQNNNARLIDSDEAKSLLGDVNQAAALHQESDGIATDQMLRAAKRGDNVVLPLVGKNPERVNAAISALKDQNYDVHLHYNHLDPNLAAQRAVTRFNETGRFVDPHYVMNEVGLRPKQTYDILKNNENVTSYHSYDNNVPIGQQPKLIEEGTNSGLQPGTDTAGRSLREPTSQETSKSTQAQEVNPNLNEGAFTPKDIAKLDQMAKAAPTAADLRAQYAKDIGVKELSPEDLANLSPQQQMDLYNAENPVQKNAELTPEQIAQADANNPVKVQARFVNPNSKTRFQDARGEIAAKTHPITIATDIAAQSAKKAGFKSAFDLGDRVEHPEDYPEMANRGGKLTPARQAVEDYKTLTNLISATSHSLGGKDAYLNNFVKHAVDTQDWAKTGEAPVFDAKTGKLADPSNFRGIDAISRKTDEHGNIVYPDMRSLHDAGMKLQNEDNVDKFIRSYGGAAAYKTEKQAITKAFSEADGMAEGRKTNPLPLGDEKPLMLSDEAFKEAKSYLKSKPSIAGKIIDKPTSVAKEVLLSTSQYHPININVLQAAPYLAGKGRPDQAAMGLIDTARNAIDTGHALNQERADLHSGLIEKSARIGAPLYKSDFDVGSKVGGGKMVFGRQIPAMQRRVNAVTIKSLERRGIDLGSAQARSEGDVANSIMGFYDNAMHNTNPAVQRWISRFLLAPNFEESKLNVLKTIVDPRASAMARVNALTAVAGKYATEVGLAVGLGKLFGQKYDSLKDTLKREAVSPEISTPFKNSSGDNIKFKLPDSGESEIANLLLNTNRDNNGRIQLKPNGYNQVANNLLTDVRDKFAPTFSSAIDVATNKNYAGQPLWQPNQQEGVKAEQGAANIVPNFLPIGLQGALYAKPVESRLPGNVQNTLNQNKPGENAFYKSGLTTVTATPETDQTTGEGLATAQYVSAMDGATHDAPAATVKLLDQYSSRSLSPTGQKIAPGTVGDYLNAKMLTGNTPAAKDALQRLYNAQHSLKSNDPLWSLPLNAPAGKPSVTAVLKIQSQYEGEEKDGYIQAAQGSTTAGWYTTLQNARQAYFAKLPPTKDAPAAEPAYPTFKGQQATDVTAASKITDTTQYEQFLDSHPDVVDANLQKANWTNQIRVMEGGPPQPIAPNASPQVTAAIQEYNSLAPSKSAGNTDAATNGERSAWIKANPDLYSQISNYYANSESVDLIKSAVAAEYSGQDANSQAVLKYASDVGSDVVKTSNSNGTTTYSLNPAAAYAASGSGSSSSSSSSSDAYYNNEAQSSLDSSLISDLSKSSSDYKNSETIHKAPTLSYKTTPIKSFKVSAKGMHIKTPKGIKTLKQSKMPKPKLTHVHGAF